ncbi:uncharacterized protein LOC128260019 [Drosophila gunungcola]|uniref:uncharacterized protein LOC108148533 n=1 Tax=Drosophila elegans TaxID=30023 RepID=UPI0007E5EF83|nr:uncharacterized protein LOC108148533 [Drosophila elegans]XP_052848664.1 uncharacterized protein LOC128260019 [Drosophila gunungcola]
MGCCFSTSKSVDLPPVPPAPGKQRSTLPEFPVSGSVTTSAPGGFGSAPGGATNAALEDD